MKGITPARRAQVAPFLALDIMADAAARERAGASIIHMEVGEPCHPAPRRAREAAISALSGGRLGYTEALGRPTLRARIAQHYAENYGVAVGAERIVVTTGSSGGFILALLTLFDAGARVAIAAPGYPAYRNMFQALGLETVTLRTTAADRFALTADAIERAHAAKPLDGLLLMSPANPSGTLMRGDTLGEIYRTCERLGIALISDEIYHGLTYGRPAETALRHGMSVTVVNSFSKYYCMTGWRIGWLVLPSSLVAPVERLQQNLSISVPTLSQIGAEAAFRCARRTRSDQGGLRALAGAVDECAADGRPRRLSPAGRRLLPLRRHNAPQRGCRALLRAHARRDRHCRNAGNRLRPRRRPPHGPILLCRSGGRYERGRSSS